MTSSFTEETTGDDVVATFPDQVKGRTFVITGASHQAIGGECAISLASAHPKALILCGRSKEKVEPVISRIRARDANVNVHFVEVDLASQRSVRKGATEISQLVDSIDVVLNCGGVMVPPYSKTEDGLEMQFGTNHIGHFLLVALLLDKIIAAAPGSRIVNVSSGGYLLSPMQFHDINFETEGTYNLGWEAYGQSKTANILHARSLASKLADHKVYVYSLHPGAVSSNLTRTMDDKYPHALDKFDRLGHPEIRQQRTKTVAEGAKTPLVACLDPELETQSGAFLIEHRVTETEPWARSTEDASRLWELSEEIIGQKVEIPPVQV